MSNTIVQLLTKAYEEKASDLHLSFGIPAVFRIDGQLSQLGDRAYTSSELEQMVEHILPDNKKEEFRVNGEADFNYALEGLCRFRVNAYHQRGEVSIAARLISTEIPTIEQLGMPEVLI